MAGTVSKVPPNDEVERRTIALPTDEADLSRSSTHPLCTCGYLIDHGHSFLEAGACLLSICLYRFNVLFRIRREAYYMTRRGDLRSWINA